MYSLVEAARLLRVPATTLRSWTSGQDHQVRTGRRFRPPIPVAKEQARDGQVTVKAGHRRGGIKR